MAYPGGVKKFSAAENHPPGGPLPCFLGCRVSQNFRRRRGGGPPTPIPVPMYELLIQCTNTGCLNIFFAIFQICLAHCYRVNDAGIQWLVGSCYSPKIQKLNLSNTELTGNCFLRMMPHLTSLILDCCSSLNGQGLCNIAARYTVPLI